MERELVNVIGLSVALAVLAAGAPVRASEGHAGSAEASKAYLSGSTPPAVDPRWESEFISLEAQTQALSELLQANPRTVVEIHLHRARVAWQQDPAAAAALLNLAIRTGLPHPELVHALTDAARAEAQLGHHQAALAHYLRAIEVARQAHTVAAAFEGFVRVAEQAVVVPKLPPLHKYIQTISHHGQLDAVGWDTVYRLGRLLAQRGDPRAIEVMKAIPPEVPAGRRALYIQGVSELRQGHKERARELFLQAAQLPPYPADTGVDPERDQQVVELSWLAVGRLAFDAGDAQAGYYAYQQIPTHSPRFLEAYYELGWLALELGEEQLAEAAFSPVVALDERNHVGRKARLIRGYLMLKRRQYPEAQAHYQALAEEFTEVLQRFDAAVARIDNLGDLARECEARRQAMADPLLAGVLNRDEVVAARRMADQVETLRDLAFAISRQRAELDTLLSGEGPLNPFQQIDRDRRAVQRVLNHVHQLASQLDRTASLKGDAPPCCSEPRLRARKLRNTLETFMARLGERETKLRQELVSMRGELDALAQEQTALYQRLEEEVQQAQQEAVTTAINKERQELHHLVMEGEAGVLQALWSVKEEGRDAILALEQERKAKLDALLERFMLLGPDR